MSPDADLDARPAAVQELALEVLVDLDAASPVYEQIRSQVAAYVLTGALRKGDRLPTVRALAADLGVAVNTVARAYQELELEGFVRSRRRTGTFVAKDDIPLDLEGLRQSATLLAREARRRGLTDEVVMAFVRQALNNDAYPAVPSAPRGIRAVPGAAAAAPGHSPDQQAAQVTER